MMVARAVPNFSALCRSLQALVIILVLTHAPPPSALAALNTTLCFIVVPVSGPVDIGCHHLSDSGVHSSVLSVLESINIPYVASQENVVSIDYDPSLQHVFAAVAMHGPSGGQSYLHLDLRRQSGRLFTLNATNTGLNVSRIEAFAAGGGYGCFAGRSQDDMNGLFFAECSTPGARPPYAIQAMSGPSLLSRSLSFAAAFLDGALYSFACDLSSLYRLRVAPGEPAPPTPQPESPPYFSLSPQLILTANGTRVGLLPRDNPRFLTYSANSQFSILTSLPNPRTEPVFGLTGGPDWLTAIHVESQGHDAILITRRSDGSSGPDFNSGDSFSADPY